MSEKLTSIRVPNAPSGFGIVDWGELSVAEMIGQYRSYADHLREHVARIDATPDDKFVVEVIRGSCVRRHVKWLQGAPSHSEGN
ncbi:hypothetical protein [Stakelama pacifica]|uniref:hypothetical protein n=1 Tax=Stakelama pacifica TaxID=517720 RepID=UPI00105D6D6A|nr:hypothetical protein [Stakelama pacifica]GGO96451.1 hypothetical protein GCM10011329_23010 [Stakelama pacifica]